MGYRELKSAAVVHLCVTLSLGLMGTGCSSSPAPKGADTPLAYALSPVQRSAAWANGDFESDPIGTAPPAGWTTTTYVGGGLSGTSVAPPQSLGALGLSAGGVSQTTVVGGVVGSQSDPDLGTAQSFRFPKYGARAARINYLSSSVNGDNRNVNALQQRMVLNANDIDPTDNQMHVRFAVAPVLENPSHPFTQQPFYYIELINLSRNTTLYRNFSVAGQAGVPWNTTTSLATKNTTQWVDWQLVDIAPGNDALLQGDQLQLTAVAGGCSLGGHFGRLYVDGLGPSVPGLYATAHGPQTASPNQTITYQVAFANGGAQSSAGTYVRMTTPPQTTFVSISQPGCTTPAPGQAGVISCPLGVVAPGAAGQLSVCVALVPGAQGSITNGTYSIGATGNAPLLGMPTTLQVQQATVAYADVSVAASVQAMAIAPGDVVTLRYTVANAGPADLGPATLSVVGNIDSNLLNPTWTCALTTGSMPQSQCGITAGNGNIVARPVLASGAAVTYVLSATLDANASVMNVAQSLMANVVSAAIDADTTNNTATTQVAVGVPRTLKVQKQGLAAAGTIGAVPAAVVCGPSCTQAQGSVADGTVLQLVAIPTSNAAFTGWDGDCTGAQRICTLTMAQDRNVTAKFTPLNEPAAPSVLTAYEGLGQYAKVNQSFAQNLVALVVDAQGLPVPGVLVSFAGPAAGASAALSPNMAVTDAWGLARTQVAANANQGAYNVVAQAAGVGQNANFALFNVGVAKTLTYVVGTSQSAAAGSVFSSALTARVLDSTGYPVPQATVTFSAPASGASAKLSQAAVVTDALGYATVQAVANATTGTFSIAAATPGASAALAFAMTNTVATAQAVYVVSGTPQTTQAQGSFVQPLNVVVTNNTGDPLPGITVSYKAPASGPSATLSATTAVTDASGQARVTAVANASPGSYAVTAAAGSAPVKASFVLTNNGSRYLLAQAGDQQQASIGQSFSNPLVVQLSDNSGAPIANAAVTFSAPLSGATGVVQSPNTVTDAQGNASTSLRAGNKAGFYQVSVSAPSVAVPVTLNVANTPGPAAALQLVSGNNQSQSVQQIYAQAMAWRVVDNQNNAVPGVSVTFAEPSDNSGGTLSVTSAISDAQGLVSVSAAAGKAAGSYAVVASAGAALQQAATLTTTPGAIAQLIAVSGDGQSTPVQKPFAKPLVVRAVDAVGNPVSGAMLQPLTTPQGAYAAWTQAPLASDADGLITVRLTANAAAASYALTLVPAKALDTAIGASFGLTNLAGAAASLTLVAGDKQSVTVGQAFGAPFVVQVVDAQNNAVAGAQVRLGQTAPGPQGAGLDLTSPLAAFAVTTDAAGVAKLYAAANTKPGSYVAQVNLVGTQASQTLHLTHLAGAAAGVACTSQATREAKALAVFADPLQVRVTDTFGNVVQGSVVTFTAPASGPSATLSSATCTTNASGLCQISATAQGAAGSGQVMASLQSGGGDPPLGTDPAAAFFNLTVLPGAAAQLTMTSEPDATTVVDTAFAQPLVARVSDAGNNPVAGVAVSFGAPATGASLRATTASATSDASGYASLAVQAGHTAGDYNVRVSFVGQAAPALVPMHNTPGAAANISVVSGDKQTNAVLSALMAPLVLAVTDAFGNQVQHQNVILGAPEDGPGAVFDAPMQASDANGLVSFVGTTTALSGSYQVVAYLTPGAAAASFSLKNLAGPPTSIAIASGDAQQLAVGTALTAPLIAVVTDAQNNPVPNVQVSFAGPSSGPGLDLDMTTYVTNGRGLVGAQGMANTVAGVYNIMASLPNAGLSATFAVTNLSGGAASLSVVAGDMQTVTVGTSFNDAFGVAVADAQGNPVQGAHIRFVMHAPQAGISLNTASVTTDKTGAASVLATALHAPGTAAIDAVLDDGTTTTLTATLVPGPAVLLVADPQASVQAAQVATGYAAPLGVIAYDAFGNVVPGVHVAFTAPTAPATALLSALTAVTDSAGHAGVEADASVVTGIYTVTASLTDQSGPSAAFVLHNLAGPPHDLLAVTAPQAQAQVKTPYATPLRVVLRDLHHNAVPFVPVQFVVPSAGATASLDNVTVLTDLTGQAQVTAVAGSKAGSFAVIASYISGQSPALFDLTNTPGPLRVLRLDDAASPQAQRLGTAFAQALRLVATDQGGNPIAGVGVTFSQPTTGAHASLSQQVVTTDTDGSAQIDATADRTPGSYAVVATTAPTPDAPALSVTAQLTNVAGAIATVASLSDVAQSTPVTMPFGQQLSVVVMDNLQSPISDVNVTFLAPQTGATAQLAATTVTTDDNGAASVIAIANGVAGSYNVVASYAAAASPFVFRLHNQQGPATYIAADTTATPQTAAQAQPFARALSVLVTDDHNNPEPNQTVRFTLPATSPEVGLSSQTAVTDAAGYAQVTAVGADTTLGDTLVSATVVSSRVSTGFALRTTGLPPPILAVAQGGQQSIMATQGFGAPVAFVLRSSDGDIIVNAEVTLSSDPPGLVLSGGPWRTDANGYVSVNVGAGRKTGSYRLLATTSNAQTPASAELHVSPIATEISLMVDRHALALGETTVMRASATSVQQGLTGHVMFAIDGQVSAAAALDSAGHATQSTPALRAGSHTLTATLVADDPYAAAASPAITVAVDAYVVAGGGACAAGGPETGMQSAAAWLVLAGLWAQRQLVRRRRL